MRIKFLLLVLCLGLALLWPQPSAAGFCKMQDCFKEGNCWVCCDFIVYDPFHGVCVYSVCTPIGYCEPQ